MVDKQSKKAKKQQEIKSKIENENLEKAAKRTLSFVGMEGTMFNPDRISKYFETYTSVARENYSWSEKSGHMNEYEKAINNHKQQPDKPFNKIDGVGI